MDRRTFCNWVSLGLLANSMPMAIAACSSNNTEAATNEFRQIGTMAELEKEGQILNQQNAGSPILVVRDSTNPTTPVAINPTCTHRDCVVNWDKQQNLFLCNCHESKFDTTGKVLGPPAEEPLTTYRVKVDGDRIFVSNSATNA
ncbi:ubiquinol-cytochrome c reductase iron-sulfur subunit [Kovacikia minuta CCNUW1]|uniref:QcrA and Rieske domain-containing protein n=1 Tax=Kovacikia minuta TaxID=2931930 RepID=UPI001CCEE67A|nr:ubiquinol-cytochrome c reductase iron-sulfur subunit [Kovacikia minuta]UBF24703.1 ubiquinol-cytochrome c reductase iron-sulfur subunit [Kovacikia minuta CCNUW1]